MFSIKIPILENNGGHLGFAGHFEFCDHEHFYVGHIVLIQCMFVCDFVLIRLTDFKLEAKMWFWDQISCQIWPLTSTGRGQFLRNLKNAFTSLFVWSSRLSVPIFGHIGHAGSKREAKRWFLGQILSKFDLWPLRMRSNLSKFRLYILVWIIKTLNLKSDCHQYLVAILNFAITKVYTRNIILIPCMFMCDFMLSQISISELLLK